MDKIQIVNFLLTRRCNLKCNYCGIVRTRKGSPPEYPDIKHYFKNEMDLDYVIAVLKELKLHNPDIFIILYGGEPLLRKDLPEIVNYCNSENINYTIITNNTEELQPMFEDLLLKTEYITGLTSSIDPLVKNSEEDPDRLRKCTTGFKNLIKHRDYIKDLVAEITVDNNNVSYISSLIHTLSTMKINSDLTFIDIAKSPYYDFSNVTDKDLLVSRTKEVEEQMNRIIDRGYDVHMAKTLLPKILDILPSELDCKMEENISAICIDADGTMRLCLRIRGVATPNLKAVECFKDGKLMPFLKEYITRDKKNYCRGCNHTCYIMSDIVSKTGDVGGLIHDDRR